MKLLFMKRSALTYIKANIRTFYINYYRNKSNEWIYDLFDYDPFEYFIEVPDFSLALISDKKGEMDVQNCKILYDRLKIISESQASDERLWAGLCNGVFYDYVRRRWGYDERPLKDIEKDAGAILSRFYFSGGIRAGFYRNTLAKCWWVGKATFQESKNNKFELLDALGPDDFSSKVTDLFYSNTFASNTEIITGICKAWKIFRDKGINLPVREYFRPTLQYLNVIGGGVLLDIYSSEEIKKIVFDYITMLLSGESGTVVTANTDVLAEEDENNEELVQSDEVVYMKQVTKETASTSEIENKLEHNNLSEEEKLEIVLGIPNEVNYGCRVLVHNERTNKDITYQIPAENGERRLYTIEEKMIGKQVGYRFFLSGAYYRLVEIHW